MTERPNDRIDSGGLPNSQEDPRIFMVVNGEKFPRPGLETYFVETTEIGKNIAETGATGRTCYPVMASYCQCNKVVVCSCQAVCVCEAVCTCESVSAPVRASAGSGRSHLASYEVCSCDLICTCDSKCSCDSHVQSSGGGGFGYGCRCAPVH